MAASPSAGLFLLCFHGFRRDCEPAENLGIVQGTRGNPTVIKFGFIIASLVFLGLGWQATLQPGNRPDVTIMALTFAVYQGLAELIFLPLYTRAVARKRPYSPADMLIHLAVHENGILLGFVLTFLSRDPRYLYYFGLPCLALMLLTPTGKR